MEHMLDIKAKRTGVRLPAEKCLLLPLLADPPSVHSNTLAKKNQKNAPPSPPLRDQRLTPLTVTDSETEVPTRVDILLALPRLHPRDSEKHTYTYIYIYSYEVLIKLLFNVGHAVEVVSLIFFCYYHFSVADYCKDGCTV